MLNRSNITKTWGRPNKSLQHCIAKGLVTAGRFMSNTSGPIRMGDV